MSTWPLNYDWYSPNPLPSEHPSSYRQITLEKLWDMLIIHLEIFITYHIYTSTTLHFLSISFHILNGTLRDRGDLSFIDAATLHWVHRIGENNGAEWARSYPDWIDLIHQEQRCYEMVKNSASISNTKLNLPIQNSAFKLSENKCQTPPTSIIS